MEKVYEIYIRTTPERLWQAITDPDVRQHFEFGNRIDSDWQVGSRVAQLNPGFPGGVLAAGDLLEIDPPKRLVQTFQAFWSDEVRAQGVSRLTWEIEQVEDSCRLLVIHDQLRDDANPQLYGGWPMIISGLKTWLETGTELTTPGSLMYGGPRP